MASLHSGRPLERKEKEAPQSSCFVVARYGVYVFCGINDDDASFAKLRGTRKKNLPERVALSPKI